MVIKLTDKLIVDIQNKDFEADLAAAIKTLDATIEDYWLMDIYRKLKFKTVVMRLKSSLYYRGC